VKLFLNYRREDTAPYAGRLYDRLTTHFGRDQVFIDIDQIQPGEDFVEAINAKVGACDAVMVLIGTHWLEARDARGQRRLDDSEDFVRMEIVAALERKIRVIPVLVGGAAMPPRNQLPEPLAPLSRRNAIEITETRFHSDVDRLVRALDRSPKFSTPNPPSPGKVHGISFQSAKRNWWVLTGICAAVILVGTIWFAAKSPFRTSRAIGPALSRSSRSAAAGPAKPREPFTNSIGMKLQWIEPLKMWVGEYEVTQAEFQETIGGNPSLFKGDRRPVDKVTWNEAINFCRRLTEKDRAEGIVNQNLGYRLPDDDEFDLYIADAKVTDAVTSYEGIRRRTAEVGSFGPNKYGLYDVRGNVWEWTSDKQLRGGCWDTKDLEGLATSYRFTPNPKYDCQNFGFRCVLTAMR
jgi:hypothetical protein